MTRTEAIKEFFKKAVLPVAIAGLLYCIFKSACIRNGELDLLWLWILCGLPFGIHRMYVWIVPGGSSLGGGAALFALNFIIGGLIGGFVLVCAPHHLPPDCGVTALWKCGKRPLRRWKTDIHGPMEKPPAFPQPANIVSHSSTNMTVYAHSHSAYYGEYSSYPVLSDPD